MFPVVMENMSSSCWNYSCVAALVGYTTGLFYGFTLRVYSTGLFYGFTLRVYSTGLLYGFILRVYSTGLLYSVLLFGLFAQNYCTHNFCLYI
jgi:hypothetical protein